MDRCRCLAPRLYHPAGPNLRDINDSNAGERLNNQGFAHSGLYPQVEAENHQHHTL
jgi:hypothetical protein